MIKLLDDKMNPPSKFRTKKWVEINDESRGAYKNINHENNSNNIKFKTPMIRSNSCDYSDAHILAREL